MFTIENTIYVDISNLKYARAKTKQFDDKFRYITILLNDNGKPLNLEGNGVKVYIQKTDNTMVLNDVKFIDAKNGIIQIELTSQMTAVEGIMPAEIVIWQEDRQAITTSYRFEIEVEKTYFKQANITSQNEFSILGTLVRFENYDTISEEWSETEDGLYEIILKHDKNAKTIFARGIGEDGIDRIVASEILDEMTIRLLTDERENMRIVLEYRFA